jgi:pimeloyl-ACP methyl ester carboxylesterase
MKVLNFICDVRFHRSFVLPPNPETGRGNPYRVSYSDYGEQTSDAVVLFCGALMGTRFCYSPLDQLAKVYNVRIIHPDRPGIGGSDPVELQERIPTWLGKCMHFKHSPAFSAYMKTEIVPALLTHLKISHVSLASHSGGDIYLLNTMLTYPYLLHPTSPYICFFAPWVHPSHSKITQLRAAELLPAPLIGRFASLVRFVNDNVIPLAGMSSGFIHGLKGSLHYLPSTLPAPVPLAPDSPNTLSCTASRTSMASRDGLVGLALNDPVVVDELRQLITTYLFAESIDGISADAQIFLKKPHLGTWCSRSIFWADIDNAVPLLSRTINEQGAADGTRRKWLIDAFHAEMDEMVGEKGRIWFDECWTSTQTSTASKSGAKRMTPDGEEEDSTEKPFEYKSAVVPGSEHNYLMDPAYGASDVWLQRVRESFPLPEEV